jgi:hypothetical protein
MKGVLRLQCIHLPPLHFTKKKGSKQGHRHASGWLGEQPRCQVAGLNREAQHAQRNLGATASTASSMLPPSRMLRSGLQPCSSRSVGGCGAEDVSALACFALAVLRCPVQGWGKPAPAASSQYQHLQRYTQYRACP